MKVVLAFQPGLSLELAFAQSLMDPKEKVVEREFTETHSSTEIKQTKTKTG